MRGFPLTLERSQDVSCFCQSVLNLNQDIVFAGAINKNGRILESTLRDDRINKKLETKEFEMMLMQSCLRVSMMKDFDAKLGLSKYSLVERENILEFAFPFSLGIIHVMSSPQINPKKLAKKISKLVYEFDLWIGAQKLR